MENGWIKIHRLLLDKPIWKLSTPEQRSILIAMLLLANHKPNEWEWKGDKFLVQKGEFVTSLSSLANQAGRGISVQNVRSALARFEVLGFSTYKPTKRGRIITIQNWEQYQLPETTTQQGNQQRGNKEVTTNKNVRMKEYKKKKVKRKKITPIPDEFPVTDQMRKYASSKKHFPNLEDLTEAFQQHYQANGEERASWYASWQTWLRRDIKWHGLADTRPMEERLK